MPFNKFPPKASGKLATILLLLTLALTACNRKIAFDTSPVVPAAEGKVRIKKDNNGNNAIKVDIRNLAEAKRLPLPQNVYVVWIETRDGVKNLGQLKTGSSILSNTLKASLETVTPFKPSRLFITGESDPGRDYPGSQVVLTTRSF